MRTSEIVGKAHRLCEWLRKDDVLLYPKIGTVPMSWGVENATKWHVGNTDDLPEGLDRETIDSMPLRLPAKQMLIEFEATMRMADERIEPMTGFALCYDRGNEEIDCFFFGFGAGRFFFSGGGRLSLDPTLGKRGFAFYARGNQEQATKDEINAVKVVERTLVALNCTNVRSVDNAPPTALNKKRQKQGKPPLFTYKTLHVLAGMRGATNSQRTEDAEAKRSPRLHFRRGHIRRIGDGRITWVQQCMVGNGRLGMVEKAYALEAI